MNVSLKRLESQWLIEKIKFSDKQTVSNIKRASKDPIKTKANIEIDEEWAYTISYHAMLRADVRLDIISVLIEWKSSIYKYFFASSIRP